MASQLIGYNREQASGLITLCGGTATRLYGVKLGLEKACPGTIHNGTAEDAVVSVSDAGHTTVPLSLRRWALPMRSDWTI